MQHLRIVNPHFITYTDALLTIDMLGGVDLQQVERMICTLRISYKEYPPQRTTLDLYNDNQTDKLGRTLCDKYELKLNDVSKTLYHLTLELEEYRLQQLKFTGKQRLAAYELSEEETKKATTLLKHKNILAELVKHFTTIGILGEDENALILFLALASYKFNNPFSVICLAKSGIGKSYILQKLSECMPPHSFSFHTRISANALYYFDSTMINQKALMVEDLEWTTDMLAPLSTLQTQGRLVNTRATKDKDGMLHSTTFEVNANLCLVACAYDDKTIDEATLPFLCIRLNNSFGQDMLVMEYQKKMKAGLIQNDTIQKAQTELKNSIATLQNVSVINPYATLINLPGEVAYPRKSLLLLLNFIEVITYFFQYQREQIVDKTTGEIFVKTHPNDIELAFSFLNNNLLRRADELSASTRNFYNWLVSFLNEAVPDGRQAKTNQFTQLDIRKSKNIHPRTLARHLQELVLFSYVQVTGGNKHRGGFIYKLTNFDKQSNLKCSIQNDLQNTLQKIWEAYNEEINSSIKNRNDGSNNIFNTPNTTNQPPVPLNEKDAIANTTLQKETKTPVPLQAVKRIRIEQKEEYTLQLLLELEAQQAGREYITEDFTALSGRSYPTEARYLKTLWEQGKLNRVWRNRQYYYTLMRGSETVRQTPLSHSQTQYQQGF